LMQYAASLALAKEQDGHCFKEDLPGAARPRDRRRLAVASRCLVALARPRRAAALGYVQCPARKAAPSMVLIL
jgi:hypothetical protein